METESSHSSFKRERMRAMDKAREDVKLAIFSGRGKFIGGNGIAYLITPSNERDVLVRVTRISSDGTPLGHLDFCGEDEIESYLNNQAEDGIIRAAFEQSRPDLAQGWKHGLSMPKMRRNCLFRYRLKMRPASIGTHPDCGIIRGYNEVEYERALTFEEMESYEMEPLGAIEK